VHIVPIEMQMMCLALLFYACVAYALCVGFCMMVIDCMVVPFRFILIIDVLHFYD
jgi:hypothetical protein